MGFRDDHSLPLWGPGFGGTIMGRGIPLCVGQES